jgi:hypothetical protein
VIRLTDLVGQPTVSLADAEPTGTVRGIVTDGDRIVAVHNGEGVIDAAVIRSFEGDAVTYDGDLRAADRDADSPLGRRVLDVDGDELGRLADLEIDASGHVDVVLLDDGRTIAGTALRVIGSYAVIVAANPDTTLSG